MTPKTPYHARKPHAKETKKDQENNILYNKKHGKAAKRPRIIQEKTC